MTAYAALSLLFLGLATTASVMLVVARGARPRAAAVLLALGAMVLLTAVFDSLMIAAGLFHYDEAHLFGFSIGLAPVEDFAYPIAGVLLLPTLWSLLRARRDAEREDRR